MRTIYVPVDIDLLESGRFYWCANWQGRTVPRIIEAYRPSWGAAHGGVWVFTDGNEHTEVYCFDDRDKESDRCTLKLIGPIEIPEELR